MRKIDYAVRAAAIFIRHLHTENLDRGMIASFGNTFEVPQPFTPTEQDLHRALAYLASSLRIEGTRLYQSIEDLIECFWSSCDQHRPWVIIVITDGIDNFVKSRYYKHPELIGQHIKQRFQKYATNFIFVVGVGDGHQIDRNALAIMGNGGGFPAIPIDAFPLLELAFLRIAIRVTEQIVGVQITTQTQTWAEIARIRQLHRVGIDYAFLIDRSDTMSDPGD